MQHSTFNTLIEKFLDESATAAEKQQLALMLEDPFYLSLLDEAVMKQLASGTYRFELDATVRNTIDQSIYQRTAPVIEIRPKGYSSFLRSWWAAASVALLLGIGAYTWMSNRKNIDTNVVTQATADKAPGSNGAILTLADGRQVVLDSLENGLIATQNGSDVVLNNGLLAYDLSGKSTEAVVYNTITTPKARQFAVTLPDGTRVWLNAASSIRYPTVFNALERRVVVTGEVFLEVADDKNKPFLVGVQDMEVQVLGTSFNINAYSDEPAIKTTLLEGSIKALKKSQPQSGIILQPGQQAIFDERITLQQTVDLEQTIAWKNGVFNLNGATLEEFMRQIARWYDLKVIYKSAIPYEIFEGKIGRDLQLSQILKVLTQFNIKYQLSGNTITIEPQ